MTHHDDARLDDLLAHLGDGGTPLLDCETYEPAL